MFPAPRHSDANHLQLVAVKLIHTLAWAFFAGCIFGMPIASWAGQHGLAGILAILVLVEVIILALNGWTCPLTAVAARYTEDRESNFDIYLPVWLARYNKHLFGPLYVVALIYAGVSWATSVSS
jgi:polyferredoxin